jgi:hypothetical protein
VKKTTLKNVTVWLVLFLPHFLWAQDSLPTPKILASFQQASALVLNPALDEIFVIDAGSSKLYKLNTQGKVISNIGGFGVDREAFDTPRDIATDGMNVFIADRGNQRIAQYDRFLNFKTLLQNRPDAAANGGGSEASLSEQLWRPISVSLSPQGDLFLLEEAQREAIRINPFTFNSQQQVRQNPSQFTFGGFSSGNGILKEPYRLQATKSGKIFISDEGYRAIMVYDLFGNFVAKIGGGILKTPRAMSAGEAIIKNEANEKNLQEWLAVVDEGNIFFFETEQITAFKFLGKLTATEIETLIGNASGRLVDIGLSAELLYLLTEKKLFTIPLSIVKIIE